MRLRDIAMRIPGTDLVGEGSVMIGSVACDSRSVAAGDLFVALKGMHFDGTRFIGQALARGAAAIAIEHGAEAQAGVPTLRVKDTRRFLAEVSSLVFDDPASRMKITAVTGTNGKTTVVHLMDSICREAGLKCCISGTLGAKVGGDILRSEHTTPEAPDLLRFLRRGLDSGCTHAAIEASSHGLHLKRLYGVKIHVAVFTNLTPDHLDYHNTLESYYAAKRLLFTAGGNNRIDFAVINADDPFGLLLSSELTCPALRFGFSPSADVFVSRSSYGVAGSDLIISTPQGDLTLHSSLVGRHNAYNIMAATGAALCQAIGLEAIAAGIERLSGVPGRMELVNPNQPFAVYVDYAHTPDALQKLLETVSQLPHGRIITVFGCGGDRDRTKRPQMGEIAVRLSDYAIATSDNPRTEDPTEILREIEQGLRTGSPRYCIQPDRRAAIASAVGMARAGDIVILAGKGHEDYQIIGTEKLPFDDRAVARESLLNRSKDLEKGAWGELHQ